MLGNWISETTATVGTGDITLGGASAADLLPFSSQFVNGDTVQYTISDRNSRESGIGLLTAGSQWTLARVQVYEKFEGGVYSQRPAVGIDLSGSALVSIDGVAQTLPNIYRPQGTIDSTAMYQTPPGLWPNAGPYTFNGKAGGEFSGGPNIIILMPCLLPDAQKITAMFLRVVTAVTGANARLGIYSAHPTTRLPDRLLADSGDISLSATGMVGNTLAAPVIVPRGLCYIADIGDDATATATCNGCRGSSMHDPIGSNAAYQVRKLGYNHAFGAFPSTLTAASILVKPNWASYGHFWQ